jgi:hypothetical protein
MTQLPADFPAIPDEDASLAAVITWLIELIRWWFAREAGEAESGGSGDEARTARDATRRTADPGRTEPARPSLHQARAAEEPDPAEASGPATGWGALSPSHPEPPPSPSPLSEALGTDGTNPRARPQPHRRTHRTPRPSFPSRSAPYRTTTRARERESPRVEFRRRGFLPWPTGGPRQLSRGWTAHHSHDLFVTISKQKAR